MIPKRSKSVWKVNGFYVQQEANAKPALKSDFSQHKWMFLSVMQTLPLEGHNVAYQFKGLGQSSIVCDYEVNLSTNEKVITEKQNFNTNG